MYVARAVESDLLNVTAVGMVPVLKSRDSVEPSLVLEAGHTEWI
jgi:hypothetical protein